MFKATEFRHYPNSKIKYELHNFKYINYKFDQYRQIT